MSEKNDAGALATLGRKTPVAMGARGVEIRSMDDLARFAQMIADSGLAPKGLQTPQAIAVAIELGLEVGLPPLSALQNVAVINGRPAIYGDAALALVRASGLLEVFDEYAEGSGDDRQAVCRVKRRGEHEIVSTFSVRDAKTARLWGKAGPWTEYPERMLKFRARGFALRDGFPDVLRGFRTAEEAQDIPADTPPLVQSRTEEVTRRLEQRRPATAEQRQRLAALSREARVSTEDIQGMLSEAGGDLVTLTAEQGAALIERLQGAAREEAKAAE